MANSVKFMNEGFNKLFGITEEKSDNTMKISNKKIVKESLHKKMNESIDWTEHPYDNFKSDVYNALADIAWKYSRKISDDEIMECFD